MDKDGKMFTQINGKDVKVSIDESGKPYYKNEKGEIVHIDVQDEENLDFLDEFGKCKYCKMVYKR